MRVLITNDDGIGSEGVRVLAAAALAEGTEPVIAAPIMNQSGVGAALTGIDASGRVAIQPRVFDEFPDVKSYAVGASPALIVIMAFAGAFGPPPTAVLSGINDGPNLGPIVLYSGTVGAALAAANHGLPAMAVSLDTQPGDDATRHWRTAALVAQRALGVITGAAVRHAPLVLNVNVPNVPAAELAGVRGATLSSFGSVRPSCHDDGSGSAVLSWELSGATPEPGSDEATLRAGYATVTPLTLVAEASVPLPDTLIGDDNG